jgi:hypothetical protein
MVRGDEISSWISENRQVQLLETINHVCPKAVLVNQAMLVAGVIDPSIYASAHVSRDCK